MEINNSLHKHAILNKYELIASERRQAHLDGKLDYASYLRAYKQYKRACPLYGETFCFGHIGAPRPGEEALKEPATPTLKNGNKITTKYGDKYTVNYVIANIVYCYERGARVHIANVTRVSYR